MFKYDNGTSVIQCYGVFNGCGADVLLKTKLILLVRVRQNMFSRDVLYFYVEMFQVFTRLCIGI